MTTETRIGKKELTPKQELFVREYVKDFNGKEAIIRAGYSPKRAPQAAKNMLSKPHVQEAIKKYKREILERIDVSVDAIIQELASIAFQDVSEAYSGTGDLKPITHIPKRLLKAISAIEISETKTGAKKRLQTKKIRMYDKLKALELLGKHLGMFTDRVDMTSDGEQLQFSAVQIVMPHNGRS